ncbi:hypothetical protein RFI_29672, partial [Reticulomyxa filosa]
EYTIHVITYSQIELFCSSAHAPTALQFALHIHLIIFLFVRTSNYPFICLFVQSNQFFANQSYFNTFGIKLRLQLSFTKEMAFMKQHKEILIFFCLLCCLFINVISSVSSSFYKQKRYQCFKSIVLCGEIRMKNNITTYIILFFLCKHKLTFFNVKVLMLEKRFLFLFCNGHDKVNINKYKKKIICYSLQKKTQMQSRTTTAKISKKLSKNLKSKQCFIKTKILSKKLFKLIKICRYFFLFCLCIFLDSKDEKVQTSQKNVANDTI